MHFLVICKDTAEAPELRQQYLKEHLDYIKSIMEHIQVAGPLMAQDADGYWGSCLIYRAESASEALELLFGDPYYRAGVWGEYRINEFRGVAGHWVGGKNW